MNWPHAPVHKLEGAEAFMFTGSTLHKAHLMRTNAHLNLIQANLHQLAQQYGWEPQAWALFTNHYHLVLRAGENADDLAKFIKHFHSEASRALNRLDGVTGRKVFYQFHDTKLTYQKSYLARINYTMNNPVRHGLVKFARDYPWCSAGWFEKSVTESHFRTVTSFPSDQLNILDNFRSASCGICLISQQVSSDAKFDCGADGTKAGSRSLNGSNFAAKKLLGRCVGSCLDRGGIP